MPGLIYPPPLPVRHWNLVLGGHFPTPLALWAGHYTAGRLAFPKWGHIDEISDYPANRILFVDYDSFNDSRLTVLHINSTFRAMGMPEGYTALRINRSRRGLHVAIILKTSVTPIERVAMEAILGDDSMRAAMNFARARNVHRMPKFWRQRWNILYDYKLTVRP
jgi:hypothetical protein